MLRPFPLVARGRQSRFAGKIIAMDLPANIVAKLRELPAAPGVYQMKDKRGRIIYIGKALSLKNRVPTYFQAGAENDPRICHLVRKIADLDWIIVHSEIDALMLESSLIRQFKPYYNTFLKDDKSYPYVKITNEPFPRVMLTRRYLNDKAKYWGPLTGVREVRSRGALHRRAVPAAHLQAGAGRQAVLPQAVPGLPPQAVQRALRGVHRARGLRACWWATPWTSSTATTRAWWTS